MGDGAARRWVRGLLCAYLLLAAVVLLAPVSYGAIIAAIDDLLRHRAGITWFGSGWIEFAANVALFVPLGALLTLLTRRPWWGALLALALSVSAELAQLVLPGRLPTARDVVANALGAAVGAAVAWWAVTRRRAPPTATTRAR
jgi:hypothetical protein